MEIGVGCDDDGRGLVPVAPPHVARRRGSHLPTSSPARASERPAQRRPPQHEDVLQPHATEGWPQEAPVLCRVKMINEFPLIPDLEKLEAMLARELTQA